MEARELLSLPGIQTVGLRGQEEGIRYEPLAGSRLIYDRLLDVLGEHHVHDYRVQSLTTIVPGTSSLADLDFDRLIIDLDGQATPIAQLARLAVRFFSRAPNDEELDHFLATGERPSP